MSNLFLILRIFTYVGVISLFVFIVSILFTKKFNNKYKKFYSMLFDLPVNAVFVQATILLNFLLILYFLFDIESYLFFGMYAIGFVCLFACLFAFNFHVIFASMLYYCVSMFLLWILSMVSDYLNYVLQSFSTFALKTTFILFIIVYVLFITIRMEEIVITNYKSRRLKND